MALAPGVAVPLPVAPPLLGGATLDAALVLPVGQVVQRWRPTCPSAIRLSPRARRC